MSDVAQPTTDRWGATPGVVHLVGAGPGDPGLLTLRAATLLGTADLVLHDQLVTPDVLALSAIEATIVPVGRRCGTVVVRHEDVIDRMASAAASGARVVRLKGGDPFVFGRGAEEAEALLSRGVPVEVVPGITSAVAGPAAAGIPVTHRGLSRGLLVVTAHTADGSEGVDWDLVARFDGTVVVLMGRAGWASLTRRVTAAGRPADQPAAVIAWASTPRQHTVTGTVSTIAGLADDAGLGTPAVLVIGDVVSIGERLAALASTPVVRAARSSTAVPA